MEEAVCERLLTIWREQREDPALIEQPAMQWDTTSSHVPLGATSKR
jgi:hypothetical protein